MAKFDIKENRWLFQDEDGSVWTCSRKPKKRTLEGCWRMGGDYNVLLLPSKNGNKNWQDTLIDLDKDDYEFEDGILRRIDK